MYPLFCYVPLILCDFRNIRKTAAFPTSQIRKSHTSISVNHLIFCHKNDLLALDELFSGCGKQVVFVFTLLSKQTPSLTVPL